MLASADLREALKGVGQYKGLIKSSTLFTMRHSSYECTLNRWKQPFSFPCMELVVFLSSDLFTSCQGRFWIHTMGGLWIFLSEDWKLQDVQVGINVVVTILSSLVILVIARVRWQRSARKVTQNKPTRISSLLGISSPGDVLDLFWFLRHRILQKRYIIALLQCLLVIILTATATFSGPIARSSTRTAQQVTAVKTKGSLAVTDKQTTLYDTAIIQAAYNSLRLANFPTNQMLDFFPDTSVPWVYEPNEWNSTWAAV